MFLNQHQLSFLKIETSSIINMIDGVFFHMLWRRESQLALDAPGSPPNHNLTITNPNHQTTFYSSHSWLLNKIVRLNKHLSACLMNFRGC